MGGRFWRHTAAQSGGRFLGRGRKMAKETGRSKQSKHAAKPEKTPKTRKKWVLGVAIAGAAVILLGAGALGFTAWVNAQDTVYPNVYVDNVAVGGMTLREAQSALESAGLDMGQDAAVVNVLDEYTIVVTAEQAGYAVTPGAAADLAMEQGRDGGIFADAVSWLRSSGGRMDVHTTDLQNFAEEAVRQTIHDQCEAISANAVDSACNVLEKTIEITKGVTGIALDEDEVYELVHQQFVSGDFTPATYEPEVTAARETDLKAIYDRIFVAPVDSQYDPETGGATEAVVGVSFDLAAAQKLYDAAEDGEKIVVDLIFTQPEITAENLEAGLFRDLLYERTTSMAGSADNRINNITLACQAINGTVLQPGDEFSFNGIVGERTWDKGYREAGAYAGGESVAQVGGGICQMSSTVYTCALYTNLEITERECHMFMVGYLPQGLDATVDWGNLDLKFINSRRFPIKIVSFVEGTDLTVQFFGTKEDDNYVEMEINWVGYYPFKTVYREDASVTSGEREKNGGEDGGAVEVYRHLYDKDGNLISTEFIGTDIYEAMDRIVLVPVGSLSPSPGVSPSAAPSAEPSPTPETTPESTPETTPESTPEPTPESTPEPTPEPTPES